MEEKRQAGVDSTEKSGYTAAIYEAERKETKMNQKKRLFLGAAALIVLIALFVGVWLAARPAVSRGEKTITVEVVHGDGSKKTFTYQTDADYLAQVLLSSGLAEGEDGSYGLFITKVDGEEADYEADQSYWAVYKGGEYASVGVSELPVNDADTFSLVYTVG